VGGGVLTETVFGQIGDDAYKPRHFSAVSSLGKKAFDEHFRNASAIISHAGMGTIAMALDHGKSLLVVPRRKKYKEVVNDHQVELAERFGALGHLLVAWDETDLPGKVRQLRSFVPEARRPDPDAVAKRIVQFLGQLGEPGGAG